MSKVSSTTVARRLQYERAFRNSVIRLAIAEDQIVGAARAISDGVRCAAVFDVCVHPRYRRQGIGQRLMRELLTSLSGQFVILTADEPHLKELYANVGFSAEANAMIIAD